MAPGRRTRSPLKCRVEPCQAYWCECRSIPGSLYPHHINDNRTPVAALRHISRVPKPLHQHRPGACDALGTPAGGGRLAGVPVAWHRRNHQMERVRGACPMCRGISQGIDNLQLLDDRAGPSVRDDERQRILMFRTNVDEMNVQPIDLVKNCGRAFSFASTLRQSYSVAQ